MRYFPRTPVSGCIRKAVDDRISPHEGGDDSSSTFFPHRNQRRAATAMEYLFIISLILCAAITGIGYFGQSTKDNMQKSSDTIQKATTK